MNTLNICTDMLLNAGGKSLWLIAVLVAGMLACRGRGAAATRHFLWLTGLLALLVLPLTALFPRPWFGPPWMQKADFMNHWMEDLSTLPAKVSFASAQFGNRAPNPATAGPVPRDATTTKARRGISLRALVFLAWSLGVAAIAVRSLGRLRALRKLQRGSQELVEAGCREALQTERKALGVSREVRLLRAKERVMPMTWGWWRPVLLLPPDAGQWDADRLRLVLRHELAHVKRWDCLTQGLAHLACALYWFNPLVWLAARQMRLERERACDDLVLNAGGQPSDYAEHLLEIARRFAFIPRVTAIPMAKPSTLEHRLRAIIDTSRQHGQLRPAVALLVICAVSGLMILLGGFKTQARDQESKAAELLRAEQLARVQAFSVAKEKQSRALARRAGEEFLPDYQRLFDAATNGNWQVVTNLYEDFKRRHAQYAKEGSRPDILPHTSYWSPVLEICLAYWEMANGEPKYTQLFVDDTINSIPRGSIYFGGTDPGRGLITAFSKSHADADPFRAVREDQPIRSQEAGRRLPGEDPGRRIPRRAERQLATLERRLAENKLKPGEDVKKVGDKVQVTGQIAVMSINALIAKIIFDKNPNRQFYIEESFPLDWMYPHLEPHGVIMKINRQPLPEIPPDVLQRDREYWTQRVGEMLGNWLTPQTSVQTVADFAEKIYGRHDLSGFEGDPRFIQNEVPQKIFSKQRSSIGGVYAWRVEHSSSDSEKTRLAQEANYAFKQAWALCPYSPEAVFRYANWLVAQNRRADALVVAETAARLSSTNNVAQAGQFKDLLQRLKAN